MEPPWPLHFLKVFCEKRFLGRETPLLAGFKLTHRCNLRCRACPFWRREAGDMPWPTVGESLEKLHRLGVRLVIFEGGEPLLWHDGGKGFADVAARARERFVSVGLTTNGTLPFHDLPVDVAWVSLDGLGPTHDALRGPSFERAVEHLRAARGRVRAYANVTVNRRNAGEIPELVRRHAADVEGFTFQFHYPYGRGEEDLTTPWPVRREVLGELRALRDEGYPVALSRACLRALAENRWTCHDFLLANVEPDGSLLRGCYVGRRGTVDCRACGFAAHAEISLAFDLHPGPLWSGWRIFRYRWRW